MYVLLYTDERQIISLNPANHRGHGEDKIPLYPVVFSRVSGHEFICLNKDYDKEALIPREFREIIEEEETEHQAT